ncbi:MAG: type II toxin-antitoxin system Phd/YefM family antitoxin [Thermoanaerobaculia bacterium]
MKTIAQRELRNQSGEILRQAEAGEQFTITVDGRPVATLGPYQKRQWVPTKDLIEMLRGLPPDPTLMDDIRELGGTLEDLGDPWER